MKIWAKFRFASEFKSKTIEDN